MDAAACRTRGALDHLVGRLDAGRLKMTSIDTRSRVVECLYGRPSKRLGRAPRANRAAALRPAAPIAEHEPDLVLHGHAHSGTFEGTIGTVPVYNVSVPVIARDFWLFELDVPTLAHALIH